MQSVGSLIKDIRLKKKVSKKTLSKATKIKEDFIDYLEEAKWARLPEYPVVVGFVKNITSHLGMDDKVALALLRRDFPQKDLKINPSPEVTRKFVWGPNVTFFVGVTMVALIIFSYLAFQYYNFIRPPQITIINPTDSARIRETPVEVSGYTNKDVGLTVNNQPVFIQEDGSFQTEVPIFTGTKELEFVARSRSGKETRVIIKITPDF